MLEFFALIMKLINFMLVCISELGQEILVLRNMKIFFKEQNSVFFQVLIKQFEQKLNN